MEVADSHIYFFLLGMYFLKIFDKVLFKKSTFSSTERFLKALFQSKLDIAFLTFSIFAFS